MDWGAIVMIPVAIIFLWAFMGAGRDYFNGTTAKKHGKKCPKCGEYMNPKSSYQRSIMNGPYEWYTDYKCPKCGYETSYQR